jgi:hypothetical protein
MSHGLHGKRRAGSDWSVQPLEGRVLLSRAGVPSTKSPSAEVASSPGLQRTATYLQASSQTNAVHPSVKLIATVEAPAIKRPVGAGRVRFSIISPTPEFLGLAHPNARGSATLKTKRLIRGVSYVIQAQFIAPNAPFAPSSTQLDVTVGESTVNSFRITAPQYFGAPGTPVTFSVTALDRAGQPVTGYTGTIRLVSPTDRSAKFLSSTYTFTTADHGTHEFPGGVTFHKGGAEVVKVQQLNNTRISGTQAFGIE